MNAELRKYIKKFTSPMDKALVNEWIEIGDGATYGNLVHTRDTGQWLWAVDIGDDFWLHACPTKAEAIKWLRTMGLLKRILIHYR